MAESNIRGKEAFRDLSPEEEAVLSKASSALMFLEIDANLEEPAKFFGQLIDTLKKLADMLEKENLPDNPALAKALKEANGDLEPLWRRLETLCHKLEALTHKQLRRAPFSDAENSFLIGYGEELAGIMLYGGNSYLRPKDDAPRVVDVFANPSEGKYLEVGIARPRALYVLYPVKDGEVLCRGAVLPYYEFQHPDRLTDAEWKTLLDSAKRPDIPAWVKPIVGSSGITVPKLTKD